MQRSEIIQLLNIQKKIIQLKSVMNEKEDVAFLKDKSCIEEQYALLQEELKSINCSHPVRIKPSISSDTSVCFLCNRKIITDFDILEDDISYIEFAANDCNLNKMHFVTEYILNNHAEKEIDLALEYRRNCFVSNNKIILMNRNVKRNTI